MADPFDAARAARAVIQRRARLRSGVARRVIAALFAALVLCLVGPARAAGRALPPGQEELFTEILGRGVALPGGCAWAGASIRGNVVASQYDCGPAKARVDLELRDRSDAAPNAVVTNELAVIVVSGAAPPGLLDAIVERVRARESKIRWIELAGANVPGDLHPGPAPGFVAERVPIGFIPQVAWLLVAVWLVARLALLAPRIARGQVAWRSSDAPAFLVVTLLALALRLAVPWGPMDFAEPERVASLWSATPRLNLTFESIGVLMKLLHGLGPSIESVYRFTGPLLGALGVGFAFLFSRAAGLRAPAAMLAAVILLVWPAHVRYSACAALTVAGPAIWLCAFTVALTPKLTTTWKIPLIVPLAVLGVYTRPEYRLLAVGLVPLVLTASWTWRARGVLFTLLAVGLAPYVIAHARPGADAGYPDGWINFFLWTLRDVSVGPPWWMLLGLAGLAVGRLDRPVRAGLVLATALLLFGYTRFASENNPFWGQWRYLVSVVPFFAIAAASLVDRIPRLARPGAMELVVGATLFSLVIHLRALTRPLDYQVEFAYVRESARRIAAARPNLVMLVDERERGGSGVNAEMNAVMAISLVLGPAGDPSGSSAVQPLSGAPRIWAQMAMLEPPTQAPGRPSPTLDDSAFFLGLRRSDVVLAPVLERFDLVPIEERDLAAAAMVPVVNERCKRAMMEVIGASLPDCPMRLGWYRFVPRPKR